MNFESEIKFEVYILHKYLNLYYDNENVNGLLKMNKDNLDVLAKALGKIDIAFFCEYFLKNIFQL